MEPEYTGTDVGLYLELVKIEYFANPKMESLFLDCLIEDCKRELRKRILDKLTQEAQEMGLYG